MKTNKKEQLKPWYSKKVYRVARVHVICCALLLLANGIFAQTFELEDGVLANGANIQDCSTCSGTAMVGNLGGTNNGSVSVEATVPSEGWYTMQISYCTADPRTIRVSVDGGDSISVPFPPSGGWDVAGVKTADIYLQSGINTLVFDNDSNWGPNLDKIEITPRQSADTQTIPLGPSAQVVYDRNNKTYDVLFEGKKVVSNAIAYAYSDTYHESTAYAYAAYTSEAFSDNLGSGTRHIITLSGGDDLEMQQVFYEYEGEDFIAVQVLLQGDGANSYKMSPLTSYRVTPDMAPEDTRALFVPYDNDAWVRYNAHNLSSADFTSSEVTGIYSNADRGGLLFGSLEHNDWKTGVTVSGAGQASAYVSVIAGWTDPNITRDHRGHGWVAVGQQTCASPKVMISPNEDWRKAFEDYASAVAVMHPQYIFNWTAAEPFGWNSWGAIQSSIDLGKAKGVVDFFKNECTAFRNEDNTLYLDLDSYWDNMSDTELAEFAAYCKGNGFKPGIYWAPFVDWGKWNRPVENSSYNYEDCWLKVNGQPFELDGAYAMDPTHPGTRARIDYFIGRFKQAGFEMIKLDFLTHASIESDSFYGNGIYTGMQAFRNGMEYLVDKLNGEMLAYAAISPNIATGPYVHMRRIACDAYKNIGETEYTLNSTTYGWWQDRIYRFLDADHVVFGDANAGENRARLASSVVTGTLITGDNFAETGPWTAKALSLLQHPELLDLAQKETRFVPVEGNTGNSAGEFFVTTVENTHYLAVFNYGASEKSYTIDMERIGVKTGGRLRAKDILQGHKTNFSGSLDVTIPGADAAIFAIGPSRELQQPEIPEIPQNKACVFPNPVRDEFRVKLPEFPSGKALLELRDISGRKVWEKKTEVYDELTSPQYISTLRQGFYVLTVTMPEAHKKHLKILKL